jgi:hypothetical protein
MLLTSFRAGDRDSEGIMKRRLLITLVLALIASAAYASEGAEPRATVPPGPQAIKAGVTLPYATVLPGVPFDIAVKFTNVSKHPAAVGLNALLVVKLPDGKLLLPQEPMAGLEPRDPETDYYTVLAPGETLEREVTPWDEGSNRWADYPQYSGPGVYEIALDVPLLNVEGKRVGLIRSSYASLTREVSPGEDEALWKKMQELSGGKWADGNFRHARQAAALIQEIIATHPGSSYYPYALILRNPHSLPFFLPKILDAAERFPNSPAISYLHLSVGLIEREEQTRAAARGDANEADRHGAAALKHFAKAIETTTSPSTRAMAHLLSTGVEHKIALRYKPDTARD